MFEHAAQLRPRVSLERVVEALVPTVLEVLSIPRTPPREILDIVIFDPEDELPIAAGDLVLGVGVHGNAAIEHLLDRLDDGLAAGLVLKTLDEKDRVSVHNDGVALLGLGRGVSWSHVSSLIRSLMVPGGPTATPAEDLFGLADAVAALLDAPVTIEDQSSRVLAFSGRQDEADIGRHETILGRQVPVRYMAMLETMGVFQRLRRERTPVFIDRLTEDMLPRVAISVRAGDELLGSMWAAVDGPLSAERTRAFVEAANVVALNMLRLRAGADVGGRLAADLLATLLEGGKGAGEAASQLGIDGDRLCVLAARPRSGDPTQLEATCQRVAHALRVHVASVRTRSAAALLGGVAYAVLPVETDDPDCDAVLRLAHEFLERIGERADVVIGIGRPTRVRTEIVRARIDADRALRVLCYRPPGRARGRMRRVARFREVQVESLLLRLADLVVEDGELLPGALSVLDAYDIEHDSDLVESIAAYLEAFGDIRAAAASMHVHPNTFRYRLHRSAELSEVDLSDPEARFALMLQLRLRGLISPPR